MKTMCHKKKKKPLCFCSCMSIFWHRMLIQAVANHSNASRDMIDMGAFLVMYKNVPLIAVHSCSRACWKIRDRHKFQFPRRWAMPPPHKSQCSVWCTSSPPQSPFSPPLLLLLLLSPWHTHSAMH